MSRIERFERTRPDGVVVVVTRDIDTGEQTTVPKDEVAGDVDEQPPADGEQAGETSGELVEPKGNGSREAWAAWAVHLGIEVPDDAARDDIKLLVADHSE